MGPRHALLREEFYEARSHLRKGDGILRNILVFYGGSDLTNETMKALHALQVFHEAQPEITVYVIVGGSNPHQQEIKAFCEAPDVKKWICYHFQVDNMAEYMVQADLMLGAGGATTWERCFLELPAIVTAIADNQVRIAEDCATKGWIDYIGWHEDVTVERIVNALEQMNAGRIMDMLQTCRSEDLWGSSGKSYI